MCPKKYRINLLGGKDCEKSESKENCFGYACHNNDDNFTSRRSICIRKYDNS